MFAKVKDGEVIAWPYTWDDMRRDNPETLFPNEYVESIFVEHGAVKVRLTEQPEENHLQSVEQKAPEFVAGVLTQVWNVIPAQPAEIERRTKEKMDEVRAQRNELLVRSDYAQASDFDAGVDRQLWAAYRQQLRDVTLQGGFPWDVAWPVAPR